MCEDVQCFQMQEPSTALESVKCTENGINRNHIGGVVLQDTDALLDVIKKFKRPVTQRALELSVSRKVEKHRLVCLQRKTCCNVPCQRRFCGRSALVPFLRPLRHGCAPFPSQQGRSQPCVPRVESANRFLGECTGSIQ